MILQLNGFSLSAAAAFARHLRPAHAGPEEIENRLVNAARAIFCTIAILDLLQGRHDPAFLQNFHKEMAICPQQKASTIPINCQPAPLLATILLRSCSSVRVLSSGRNAHGAALGYYPAPRRSGAQDPRTPPCGVEWYCRGERLLALLPRDLLQLTGYVIAIHAPHTIPRIPNQCHFEQPPSVISSEARNLEPKAKISQSQPLTFVRASLLRNDKGVGFRRRQRGRCRRVPIPRALPWAIVSRPAGAGLKTRSSRCGRQRWRGERPLALLPPFASSQPREGRRPCSRHVDGIGPGIC